MTTLGGRIVPLVVPTVSAKGSGRARPGARGDVMADLTVRTCVLRCRERQTQVRALDRTPPHGTRDSAPLVSEGAAHWARRVTARLTLAAPLFRPARRTHRLPVALPKT